MKAKTKPKSETCPICGADLIEPSHECAFYLDAQGNKRYYSGL